VTCSALFGSLVFGPTVLAVANCSSSTRRDWSQNRRREPRGARHDAPEHGAACMESRCGGTAIRASLSRQAAHGSVVFRSSTPLFVDLTHRLRSSGLSSLPLIHQDLAAIFRLAKYPSVPGPTHKATRPSRGSSFRSSTMRHGCSAPFT
jgi:hypothetical protein